MFWMTEKQTFFIINKLFYFSGYLMNQNFDYGYVDYTENMNKNYLHEEPAFPCTICRKVFKRKYHMKRHMDQVHGYRHFSKK